MTVHRPQVVHLDLDAGVRGAGGQCGLDGAPGYRIDGYTGAGQGRVWGVHASPTARTADYLDLLRGLQLPGRPASIVTDDDGAIAAAVRRKWPTRATADGELSTPFLFACEHHLRLRAAAALEADNAHAGRGRWMRRLDTAFRREEAWEEFRSATAVLGHAAAWVRANDDQIARQVAVRHLLPAHYSTAGAEAAAARLCGMFEQRSFALRNAARTNLLLGLARLHLNNRDDIGTYHRLLREAAEQRAGHPITGERTNRDPRDANGGPQPSLR